jgi:hypothetical protein
VLAGFGVGASLLVGGVQACAAGGSDDSFWAPGGTPPPGGVGGAGSSTTSPSSSTTGPGSSTTGPGSSTTGPSSSSVASSTTTSSGAVSWTNDIYDPIFGPSGTSPCSINGSCHTNNQSSFRCGTDQTTCYNGFVSYGMVVPGSSATSQSSIVNPATSPLCGSLGGNMPKSGYACVTSAQITTITNWLAAGAPDN